ncbi:MAG: hypothetical protein Kow0029_02610 [Candidatus Rifleibacteriota bacterium]
MKVNKKHFGLIIASLMALSFNSHFAQAAKKTTEALQTAKAFAFKKVGKKYVRLPEVKANPVVVKKTGVRIDRKNVYIGGYVVNTTDQVVKHLRIFPTFADNSLNNTKLVNLLKHDEKELKPGETRRFVIMRPVSDVAPLLANSIPLSENCILNCYEM